MNKLLIRLSLLVALAAGVSVSVKTEAKVEQKASDHGRIEVVSGTWERFDAAAPGDPVRFDGFVVIHYDAAKMPLNWGNVGPDRYPVLLRELKEHGGLPQVSRGYTRDEEPKLWVELSSNGSRATPARAFLNYTLLDRRTK